MSKIVYQTNSDGYYVGPTEADECQLEKGVFHIPAGCVEVEPPVIGDHQCAKWNGQSWDLVPYWVGHTYWTADRTEHHITAIGVVPPADALDSDPGPTAAQVKAERVEAIKGALAKLDQDKIRPLTDALLTGDKTRLVELESQQQALRDELKSLAA